MKSTHRVLDWKTVDRFNRTARTSLQVSGRIKSVILQLGNSCVVLIQDGGAVRSRPADQPLKQQLHEHAKKVLESVSALIMIN